MWHQEWASFSLSHRRHSGTRGNEGGARRSRRWQRGPRGKPPCPTRWLARRGERDRARCRSGTTQDEIHYSFFAALTILISDSPNLPLSLSALSFSVSIYLLFSLRGSFVRDSSRCLCFSPAFLRSYSREIERVT